MEILLIFECVSLFLGRLLGLSLEVADQVLEAACEQFVSVFMLFVCYATQLTTTELLVFYLCCHLLLQVLATGLLLYLI